MGQQRSDIRSAFSLDGRVLLANVVTERLVHIVEDAGLHLVTQTEKDYLRHIDQ